MVHGECIRVCGDAGAGYYSVNHEGDSDTGGTVRWSMASASVFVVTLALGITA